MSRYIDIGKVLKELHLNHKDVIYIDKNECAKRIEKIPSIDIVFCKECKHCEYADMKVHLWCNRQERYMYADDYCSYGERKSDE